MEIFAESIRPSADNLEVHSSGLLGLFIDPR